MESYNKLSDTELLHQINLAQNFHEAIKKEITEMTTEIEGLEKLVNEKLEMLENVEHNYVDLMKEMSSRE